MNQLTLQLITGGIIGLGAGYLGSFMILRRMALVGDALSHVALPGIAAALLFKVNPFIGAFSALVLAIIIIWGLEKKSGLPSETLVGILFTSALALGLLLTPEPELLEALFGDISKIRTVDMVMSIVLVILMMFIIQKIYRGLVLGIVSKDLSKSLGIKIDNINLVFLLMISIIVALGLKVAGTLLMGSLVIIPAAAAKNIAISMKQYNFMGALFGVISSILGILIANHLHLLPGPIVVLVSGAIFLITLVFKR